MEPLAALEVIVSEHVKTAQGFIDKKDSRHAREALRRVESELFDYEIRHLKIPSAHKYSGINRYKEFRPLWSGVAELLLQQAQRAPKYARRYLLMRQLLGAIEQAGGFGKGKSGVEESRFDQVAEQLGLRPLQRRQLDEKKHSVLQLKVA